ncbi:ATP-binding protein [Sorangium sp. So ce321]|uniref:ATP-binding protein n=1 Tax=Sorangium sp. So ce321 TaxID=3133300 RepID=UPI003F5F8599
MVVSASPTPHGPDELEHRHDSRYADLLFEVVTRRYDAQKPLLLSTNKAFADWGQVFPHAACVVTLVDRLVHRAEVIEIEAESYRLKVLLSTVLDADGSLVDLAL